MRKLIALLAIAAGLAFAQNPNTAAFPSAAATDALLFVATNYSQTPLDGNITSSATSLVLCDHTADPTNCGAGTTSSVFTAPVIILIGNEILHCSTLTSQTLSGCSRGAEGTTAASHSSGVTVYGFNDAWDHNQLSVEMEAVETYLLTPTSNTATFTSQTSVAITHNLGTVNVLVECRSAATPPVRVYPSTVTFTSTSVVTVAFASSQSGSCTVLSGGAGNGGGGGQNTVSYSSTPNFDVSLGWLQKIILTGSVASSTAGNPQPGYPYTFEICGGGSGYTFVWPTSFHGTMDLSHGWESGCAVQTFVYDTVAAAYYATTGGVINQ